MPLPGLSGFVGGFASTSQALREYRDKQEREDQELALRKEDLALRRDVLKGQEASRKIQDMVHQMSLMKMLREMSDTSDARALLNRVHGIDAPEQPLFPNPALQAQPQAPPQAQPPQEALPAMDTPVIPNPDPTQPAIVGGAPRPQASALPGTPEMHQYIIQEAQRRGLNPTLALSMFRQESGYNPDAVGRGGEMGVGQWTRGTATERGLDLNRLKTDWQYNIASSLDYLADLKKRAGGDELVGVRNYNGGGDPNYTQNVLRWMPDSQRIMATTGGASSTSQMVAGPGAPAPAATSPLVRQPAMVQESPELTAINQRIAHLDTLEQRIQQEISRRPGLRANADITKTLEDIRKNRTELLTQRKELREEQTPKTEFTALLKKNNGDVAAALAEEQTRQVERKEKEQSAGKQAELQAQQQFKEGQTLLDTKSQESRQYFDIQSGQPLPQTTKVSQVKDRMDKGEVVFLDDQEVKEYRQIQRMVPLMTTIRGQLEKVYGPGGIFATLTPEERLAAAAKGLPARLLQTNPELVELERTMQANIDNLRRSLQGQVGTQTEGDAKRGMASLPRVGGIPDSQEVAYRMYNTLLGTVNGMLGTYLGNHAYQHKQLQPLKVPTPTATTTGTTTGASTGGASTGLEELSTQELFKALMEAK